MGSQDLPSSDSWNFSPFLPVAVGRFVVLAAARLMLRRLQKREGA